MDRSIPPQQRRRRSSRKPHARSFRKSGVYGYDSESGPQYYNEPSMYTSPEYPSDPNTYKYTSKTAHTYRRDDYGGYRHDYKQLPSGPSSSAQLPTEPKQSTITNKSLKRNVSDLYIPEHPSVPSEKRRANLEENTNYGSNTVTSGTNTYKRNSHVETTYTDGAYNTTTYKDVSYEKPQNKDNTSLSDATLIKPKNNITNATHNIDDKSTTYTKQNTLTENNLIIPDGSISFKSTTNLQPKLLSTPKGPSSSSFPQKLNSPIEKGQINLPISFSSKGHMSSNSESMSSSISFLPGRSISPQMKDTPFVMKDVTSSMNTFYATEVISFKPKTDLGEGKNENIDKEKDFKHLALMDGEKLQNDVLKLGKLVASPKKVNTKDFKPIMDNYMKEQGEISFKPSKKDPPHKPAEPAEPFGTVRPAKSAETTEITKTTESDESSEPAETSLNFKTNKSFKKRPHIEANQTFGTKVQEISISTESLSSIQSKQSSSQNETVQYKSLLNLKVEKDGHPQNEKYDTTIKSEQGTLESGEENTITIDKQLTSLIPNHGSNGSYNANKDFHVTHSNSNSDDSNNKSTCFNKNHAGNLVGQNDSSGNQKHYVNISNNTIIDTINHDNNNESNDSSNNLGLNISNFNCSDSSAYIYKSDSEAKTSIHETVVETSIIPSDIIKNETVDSGSGKEHITFNKPRKTDDDLSSGSAKSFSNNFNRSNQLGSFDENNINKFNIEKRKITTQEPFKPILGRFPDGTQGLLQCISAMPEYMNFSPEELRVQHYKINEYIPQVENVDVINNSKYSLEYKTIDTELNEKDEKTSTDNNASENTDYEDDVSVKTNTENIFSQDSGSIEDASSSGTISENNFLADNSFENVPAETTLIKSISKEGVSRNGIHTENTSGDDHSGKNDSQDGKSDELPYLPPDILDYLGIPDCESIRRLPVSVLSAERFFMNKFNHSKSHPVLNIFRFSHTMHKTPYPNSELYVDTTYKDICSEYSTDFNWYTHVSLGINAEYDIEGGIEEPNFKSKSTLSRLTSGRFTFPDKRFDPLHFKWSKIMLAMVKNGSFNVLTSNMLVIDRRINADKMKSDLKSLKKMGIIFHYVIHVKRAYKDKESYMINLFDEIYNARFPWCNEITSIRVFDWEASGNIESETLRKEGKFKFSVTKTTKYCDFLTDPSKELLILCDTFYRSRFEGDRKITMSTFGTSFRLTQKSVSDLIDFVRDKKLLPKKNISSNYFYNFTDIYISRSILPNKLMQEYEKQPIASASILKYGCDTQYKSIFAIQFLVGTDNTRWVYDAPIIIIARSRGINANKVKKMLKHVKWVTSDSNLELKVKFSAMNRLKISNH